ncbi:MAG: SusC/RagA family TonB-linked outer membrane protein [Gemmatimonadaceae bacterium]
MRSFRTRTIISSALSTALLTITAAVATAQGTLTGAITAQAGGNPLQEARVIVVGTSLFTSSGPDGKYTVRGISAGTAEIRVIRVGYAEQKKSVMIVNGQTATLDFVMATSVVQLQEVVTTATGEQRRVEVGNAVENLSVSQLTATAPVRSVSDVLEARVPGVMVQQGTQTGSGQRIRVRGISSVSLSNEPIFIIDGIRMSSDNGSTSFGNGGANFSRLGDISPEDIENIEIVKGPSAATLYGTDAANGVVVITTKRGRTGSSHWTAYAEGGLLDDRNWYADNYTLAGHSKTGALLILQNQCSLVAVSLGTCVKADGTKGYDSVRVYSPIKDPTVTPLGIGNRNAFGLQVSGGNDAIRYFLSGGRDDEIGVFQLDPYERNRFDSLNVTIHPWQMRPNSRLLNNFRGNISAQVNPQFDATVSFGYNTVEALTSNESNNTVGIGSQAFGGPGYRNNGLISGLPDSLVGYRAGTPGNIWAEKLQQNVNRMLLSSNLNWRPTSWLQTRANFGTDLTDRVDNNLHENGEGWPLSSTYRDGAAFNARTNVTNLSADVGATANYNPSRFAWLNLKTTVGSQYNNYRLDQNTAGGTTLPPGAITASAGATKSASEGYSLQKTFGVFVEEGIAVRDRLFLTAAVRSDQNSAFGTNFQRVYYPKGSLSWVLSDEDFFPRSGLFKEVSSLRLRLANGASGVQPGPTDALRTFSAASANVKGTDQSYEAFQAIGNNELRPERSTEWETGFDSKLFGNRIQFDMTYYSRLTHDALISAIIAPSLGAGSTSQRANLGAIKNAGMEATLGGQLIDRKQLGLDFHFNTSINANKVVSLGSTPPQIGVSNWIVPGYPINGLWAKAITGWNDKNGDGILTVDEVTIVSDTMFDNSIDPATGKAKHSVIGIGTFRGYAEPRYLTTFTSGIDLFNHKLRIQNLFDWRGGNRYYNNTERIRCTRPNCNGLFNPAASFQEQAMVVAAIYAPEKTLDGYYQPGAFVKWREATATLELPRFMVSRLHASTGSLVLSARNLHLWTNYRGSDPESDYTATSGGDAPNEFQTFAAPTLFQLRLNLGF